MNENLARLLDAIELVLAHEDFDTANPEFGELLDNMAEAYRKVKETK